MVKRAAKSLVDGKSLESYDKSRFRPLVPCSCGKPQVAAVKIPGGLAPKCAECYAAWWTPERIAQKHPVSMSKTVQEIRAAYEKSPHFRKNQ